MVDSNFRMIRLFYFGFAVPGFVAASVNGMKGRTSAGVAITVSARGRPLSLYVILGRVVPMDAMVWSWHGRLGLIAMVSGRPSPDPAHEGL